MSDPSKSIGQGAFVRHLFNNILPVSIGLALIFCGAALVLATKNMQRGPDDPSIKIEQLLECAAQARQQNQLDSYEQYLKKAVDLACKSHNQLKTCKILAELADETIVENRLDEAAQYCTQAQQALNGFEKESQDDYATAESSRDMQKTLSKCFHHLANGLRNQNRLPEAEKYYKQALSWDSNSVEDIEEAKRDYVVLLKKADRKSEAMKMETELEANLYTVGEWQHTFYDLAVGAEKGQFDESYKGRLLVDSLYLFAVRRHSLEKTRSMLIFLGTREAWHGRIEKAEAYFKQALAAEMADGKEHAKDSDLLSVLCHLAWAAEEENKHKEAQIYLDKAAAIDATRTFNQLIRVSTALRYWKRYQQAERIGRDAIAVCSKFKLEPELVAQAYNVVADDMIQQKRETEALALLANLPTPPNSASAVASLRLQASILRKMHRTVEANRLAAKARTIAANLGQFAAAPANPDHRSLVQHKTDMLPLADLAQEWLNRKNLDPFVSELSK